MNIDAPLGPLVCGTLAQQAEFKAFLTGVGLPEKYRWHWGFAAAGVTATLALAQLLACRKQLEDMDSPSQPVPTRKEIVHHSLTTDEIRRLIAIGMLFLFSCLFWAAFE
jgi:dipeptide/tripeptide permease